MQKFRASQEGGRLLLGVEGGMGALQQKWGLQLKEGGEETLFLSCCQKEEEEEEEAHSSSASKEEKSPPPPPLFLWANYS